MWKVASFYQFATLTQADIEALSAFLNAVDEKKYCGLIILAHEGVNATLASQNNEEFDFFLERIFSFLPATPTLKWSESEVRPFRRFSVKQRKEIVTLGVDDFLDIQPEGHHLKPEEWHKWLQRPDVVVLDTRNWYETKVGKFRQAIDPGLEEFQDFPNFLEKTNIPKEKPVLIYCTGGIRCEKAELEMRRQGFESVYQLEGGILNYLKSFPRGDFEGECFVFDRRVALDAELKASKKFKLCPHCGQPADQLLECVHCGTEAKVCIDCLPLWGRKTCSKDCAHQWRVFRERSSSRAENDREFREESS